MSNIIGFSKTVFGKERISMSNQGTDCFLELLELAADEKNMTRNQRKLIVFLKERREENLSAPGTASFDVDAEQLPLMQMKCPGVKIHCLKMLYL